MFSHFWKIVNANGSNADVRFNNLLRAVVTSDSNTTLKCLIKLSETVKNVVNHNKKRVKQLTNETNTAFHHTCFGLIQCFPNFFVCWHRKVTKKILGHARKEGMTILFFRRSSPEILVISEQQSKMKIRTSGALKEKKVITLLAITYSQGLSSLRT